MKISVGEWTCRNGWKATVRGKIVATAIEGDVAKWDPYWWIGTAQVVSLQGHLKDIPTYWDENGTSQNPEWDLDAPVVSA